MPREHADGHPKHMSIIAHISENVKEYKEKGYQEIVSMLSGNAREERIQK
jgi:hypothetical protein